MKRRKKMYKIEMLNNVLEKIISAETYEELIKLDKAYIKIDQSINYGRLTEEEKEDHEYIFQTVDHIFQNAQDDFCLSWTIDKLLDDNKLKKLYDTNWSLDTGLCLYHDNPNLILNCLLDLIDKLNLEKKKGEVKREFDRIMSNVPDLPSLTSERSLYYWVLSENINAYFFSAGHHNMSVDYSFAVAQGDNTVITLR